MALNGSVRVAATPNDNDFLVFSWEATQDILSLTSTINWTMTLEAKAYGRLDVVTEDVFNWSVTIDGQEFSGKNNILIGNNETKTLASGSAVLTHEADGTKSFTCTFSQLFGITWNSTGDYIDVVSGSGTWELDPIAIVEETDKFDIIGWLCGYLMSICAPVRAIPQREPIGYLYGHEAKEGETPDVYIGDVGYVGAVMPALPEYDTAKYRYLLCYGQISNLVKVVASDKPFYCKIYEDEYRIFTEQDSHSFIIHSNFGRNEWGYSYVHQYAFNACGVDSVLCTSIPITYDGITFLEPSNPVPLYNEPSNYLYGHKAKENEEATYEINGVGYVGFVKSALPEYDTEAYPYLLYVLNDRNNGGLAFATAEPFRYSNVDGTHMLYSINSDGDNIRYIRFQTTITSPWGKFETDADTGFRIEDVVCANYPIVGGSITFLEASEPIPIYE